MMRKLASILLLMLGMTVLYGQSADEQTVSYKKRVLESTEIDFLTSYYSQDGDNAAVTGGRGTEDLTDATGTFVISIPLNDDDVLSIDAGISAYTSASSSNIDAFDGDNADPFVASSGASKGDAWANLTVGYSHSSDDRNKIWSGHLSVSTEYDYLSLGVGGSYTQLFNQKNTEVHVKGNVLIDKWNAIYPTELVPFENGGSRSRLFGRPITGGSGLYAPTFSRFENEGRNSYSLGLGISQILSTKLQVSLDLDLVLQDGLLSTPFQRVYFADAEDFFIEDFHLADDIERLPDSRFKTAIGGRLHYYVNEILTVRTFYRFFFDDWGIQSHTASVELPVKLSTKFTLYPSYRYYSQTEADYFAPYNQHQSTSEYYTSDYDLSKYSSNQFGFGVGYTDIFTRAKLWRLGLKSVDLKYYNYSRDSSFKSSIITAGLKFVID